MANDGERLVVMLEARISEFEKRMRKAEQTGTASYTGLRRGSRSATAAMEADMLRSTTRINQALAASSTKIGAFGKTMLVGLASGAVLGGITALTSGLNKTIESIAGIGDAAKRAGMAVEDFQRWQAVADQNRIGIDQMTDGLKELQLRADEFVATGGGAAAEAFERMGYSAGQLQEKLKDPSKLMLEIIGRLGQMDKAAQIRVADEIFGGSAGERFVELLDKGQAGIQETMRSARVLSAEQIQKAQELDRRYKELTANIAAGWRSVAVEVGDVIARLAAVGRFDVKEMFPDAGTGRKVLGDELYESLAALESLSAAQVAVVEQIQVSTESLVKSGAAVAHAMRMANAEMSNLIPDDVEAELVALSTEMHELTKDLEANKIEAAEFGERMGVAATRANELYEALSKEQGPYFTEPVAAINALITRIGAAIGAIQSLKAEAGAGGGGGLMDELAAYGEDPHAGQEGWAPTGLAPGTSPRPRWAPPLTHELADPDAGKGKGKGKGGGGGNARIDQLVTSLQTEREILEEWYQESLDLLNGATEAQLEALGGKHEAIERLEAEHKQRMAAIDDASRQISLQGVLGAGADILGAMGSMNEKALKMSQVFATAEALISTYQGAAKELKKGKLGFAMAAAVIAKGMSFVAAIKGVSAKGGGSGGGRGGGGGGGGSAPAAAEPARPQDVILDFQSANPALRAVAEALAPEMIRQLQKVSKTGVNIVGARF